MQLKLIVIMKNKKSIFKNFISFFYLRYVV